MMLIDMTADLMPLVYGLHLALGVAGVALFATPVARALRTWLQPVLDSRPTVGRPALGHSR